MDPKKNLGIYFGQKNISLVEADGTKVINQAQFSIQEATKPVQATEELSPEIGLIANFQKSIRENKIETKDVILSLSSRDVLIRAFDLPLMPKQELAQAVLFEAKKYIPFKTEELIFDYQTRFNKVTKRQEILFVAIKKEAVDKYDNLIKELNLKENALEPSILGILRVLKSSKNFDPKISFAVIDLSDDETNLIIVDKGFPCFSRELKVSLLGAIVEKEKSEMTTFLLKFANEIRISLDYYRRQFSGRTIEKLLIISDENLRAWIPDLAKELGLSIDLLTADQVAPSRNLGLARAYAAAVKDKIPMEYSVNLLLKKAMRAEITAQAMVVQKPISRSQITRVVILCLFVIGGVYFLSSKPVNNLNAQLQQLKSAVTDVKKEWLSLDSNSLNTLKTKYMDTAASIEKATERKASLTKRWDALARSIVQGMWLSEISFDERNGVSTLALNGFVYLNDTPEELKAINKFVNDLKANKKFMQNFKDIALVLVRQVNQGDYQVTSFQISCK